MFGWFAAKCPLGTWEKTWTEVRMGWLVEQFGIDRLRNARVILPTEEFFPDAYGGDEAGARVIMDRLCDYMQIERGLLKFEVCEDFQMHGAVGHYQGHGEKVIRVIASQLENPSALVATLAHELSHELLLGQGRLTADTADHEWVTDLLPVFLGLGIFAANATVTEATGLHWWSISRQGYLPARILGYALALFAFARGESKPAWSHYLRADASKPLFKGLRYLERADDCEFQPRSYPQSQSPATSVDILARLQSQSPSRRLAGLWKLRDASTVEPTNDALLTAMLRLLEDSDDAVATEAATQLVRYGAAEDRITPPLLKTLATPCAETRAAAATTLGALNFQSDLVISELARCLRDEDDGVAEAAAFALTPYADKAQAAAPLLVRRAIKGIVDCHESLAEACATALLEIHPDPKAFIKSQLTEDEEDLRLKLTRLIQELSAARATMREGADDSSTQRSS